MKTLLLLTLFLAAFGPMGCVGLEAQKLIDTARQWGCEKLQQPETKASFDAAWKAIGDHAYAEIKEAVCGGN